MAMKKVSDLNAETTFKFEKPGQTFEGYYLGSKKVNTNMGQSTLQIFQTDKGNVGVWGSADIDRKLSAVPVGSYTEIAYLKKTKLDGGRTMKKFDVGYDDENTIEVSSAPINTSPGSRDESEDDAEDQEVEQDYSSDESEEEAEEAPAPVRAAPKASRPAVVSAERKASVSALLNKPARR